MGNEQIARPGTWQAQNQVFLFQFIQCDAAFLGKRAFVSDCEHEAVCINQDGIERGIVHFSFYNRDVDFIGL